MVKHFKISHCSFFREMLSLVCSQVVLGDAIGPSRVDDYAAGLIPQDLH